jgi:hypothetical protein
MALIILALDFVVKLLLFCPSAKIENKQEAIKTKKGQLIDKSKSRNIKNG